MEPAYVYRAEVLSVHDGDTYTLRVDLGFKCAVTIQCRLHGVDCPELNTKAGKVAKQYVADLLADGWGAWEPGSPLVIQSYKDARSFERWVCDVWLPDGRKLADVLVDAGQAVLMGR